MMEAVGTSEKLAIYYGTTRHSSLEGRHIHTLRRENLESHSCEDITEASCPIKGRGVSLPTEKDTVVLELVWFRKPRLTF